MDVDDFWMFLERSGREAPDPWQRDEWLRHRLRRIPTTHVVDFQIHLDAARRPIDSHAMWGAAYQVMDGLCSGDGFWYFQPWLIGQGRRWHERAVSDPDNLADIPAVRALAGRRPDAWANAEWPDWDALAHVAGRVLDDITGEEDSLDRELEARGHYRASDPHPSDPEWDFDRLTEIQRRLPRLASLFPRRTGMIAR